MSKIKQTLWAIVCAVLLIGAKGGGCEVASEGGDAVINYAGADTFPSTIPTPEGSDLKTAASVSAALQGLANRTVALKNASLIDGATISNYAGVNLETDPAVEINITSGTFAPIPSTPLSVTVACKAGDTFQLQALLQLLHVSGSSSAARVLLHVTYPDTTEESVRDSIRESIHGSADNGLESLSPTTLIQVADDGNLTVELYAELASGTVHLYGPAQLNVIRARNF